MGIFRCGMDSGCIKAGLEISISFDVSRVQASQMQLSVRLDWIRLD